MMECPICRIELGGYEAISLHYQLFHRAEDGVDR